MNGIDESSFVATSLPKEKITWLKLLKNFDEKLLQILEEEIKQGNKILIVRDQLSDEAMMVVLSKPFKRKYEINELQFESSADPHHGGDCYSTSQRKPHTLTAPLKR